MLSAAFDVEALLWRAAPTAQELEQVTLSWLRQMIGLPETFSGIIDDPASVSTLDAVAAAREGMNLGVREDAMSERTDLLLLRVYAPEQGHSSIEKWAIALGPGQRSLRKIFVDVEFRMDSAALASAAHADRAAGHLPFCVVAASALPRRRASIPYLHSLNCASASGSGSMSIPLLPTPLQSLQSCVIFLMTPSRLSHSCSTRTSGVSRSLACRSFIHGEWTCCIASCTCARITPHTAVILFGAMEKHRPDRRCRGFRRVAADELR
jgi:hypothetical protein